MRIPVCSDGNAARRTSVDERTLVFVGMAFNLICGRFDLSVRFKSLDLLYIEIADANAANESGAQQLLHGPIRVDVVDWAGQRLAILVFREELNVVDRLRLLGRASLRYGLVCLGRVHQEEIDVAHVQVFKGLLEAQQHVRWIVECVP